MPETVRPSGGRAVMEEWRMIPSFPAYEASSLGRIRRGSKIRRASPEKNGYCRLNMCRDGKVSRHSMHVLVCEAFHGPKPAWAHLAAHGDGNRQHNCPSNLRWATYAENSADMELHGTRRRRATHGRTKLSEADVAAIRELHAAAKGVRYVKRGVGMEIAAKFNVSIDIVKNIVGGRTW